MKPHASTHHLKQSHGAAGIDLTALGAGKDQALTDAAGPGFATIMAQQLANATDTAATQVNAKAVDEEKPLVADQAAEKTPLAAELSQPVSVDMLGLQAAQSQMMASHLKTPPKETGVNSVEAKLTEAGAPLVVDKAANRPSLATDQASQVPTDVLGAQTPHNPLLAARSMAVSEQTHQGIKAMKLDAESEIDQTAMPIMPLASDKDTAVLPLTSKDVKADKDIEPVSSMPLPSGYAAATSDQDVPRAQPSVELLSPRLADEKSSKPAPFMVPATPNAKVRNEARDIHSQLVAPQFTVDKQLPKKPEATLAVPLPSPPSPTTQPTPSTPLGLTLATQLVQAPELPASTIETFGGRMRLPQLPKSDLQQSSVDKAADQSMKSQAGMTHALDTSILAANATAQSTSSTPSMNLTEQLASAPAATTEVTSEIKLPIERPLETLPAWMSPSVATPMTPAVVVAHEAAVMHQRVGTAAFADEFVGQVNLWVKKASDTGTMTAELHLNPAEMGPVQIRIEMDGSNAQVSFVAQHLETRQAIEASMGSLSNTLQEAGIQLSGGDVSDQPSQQQASSGFGSKSDDAPRPWQSPQQSPRGDLLADANKPFLDDAAPWSRPRTGQPASGLDLYA